MKWQIQEYQGLVVFLAGMAVAGALALIRQHVRVEKLTGQMSEQEAERSLLAAKVDLDRRALDRKLDKLLTEIQALAVRAARTEEQVKSIFDSLNRARRNG